MFSGKYIRNLKKSQIPKESSASSIKDRSRYKYNLYLSNPVIEESSPKNNSNLTNTIENSELKDNKKLLINKTNKNLFNISKTLTSFHSINKTDEKEKDGEKEKDKEKEIKVENNTNNVMKEVRKRINFRERLNDSRKKRAFLNNYNTSYNNNDNKPIQNEEKNINQIREEKKIKRTENKYNISLKNEESHSKKRSKAFEIINENKENNYVEKEENNNNMEKDIKEENLGNEIKDTVKCHICQQKMVHPKMCPKCHNISCEKCLYNWFLKDQNKECNYCKEPINFYEFISVPFMDTIVDFVEKVIYDRKKYSASFQSDLDCNISIFKNDENAINDNTNNANENCEIHNTEKIYYYCLDCNKGYCKTCFVFFGNEKDKHLNHKIIEYANYKKLNLSSLNKQKEKFDSKVNYINEIINQCNSYKTLYEFEQKTINDYISSILKEYNYKMDNMIKNVENKINELNQTLESYQKTKKEIDEFYKKINIKNRFTTNTQYLIDKIEKINNKQLINENEIKEIFIIPENINLSVYKSKNIEYNVDNKYLNKKIKIGNDVEMIIDNKVKTCLNINLNIQKNNNKNHLYKAILYLIKKEENLIYAYLLDDLKEGKNYYSMWKKIQLDEKDYSLFEIKTIIYDLFFE